MDNKSLEFTSEDYMVLLEELHKTQELLAELMLDESLQSSGTYYGATDRIKQDLPYRLGSQLVKSVQHPKELIFTPVTLLKEYKAFNKREAEGLPQIEQYVGASEANKVKQQLSYQLGEVLLNSTQSPKSLLSMPIKMAKTIYSFKSKK